MHALIVVAGMLWANAAFAHGGLPDASFAWTFDGWIVGPLFVAALLFGVGGWRLGVRVRLGASRLRRRALCFAGGWLVVAVALLSPLHAGGEHSFALHMIEHELLMLAAAPLLVLAEPLGIFLWAFPSVARRRIGAWLSARPVARVWQAATRPVPATVVQGVVLWLWHVPALFDRALADDAWHIAQHASFLVGALLFWTAMIDRRVGAGVAATCLFATSIVSGALGALMSFSQSSWYDGYARLGLSPLGLSPTEDQQLAGLVMWIPGGLVHAIVALVLVRTLLQPRPIGAA